MSYFNYISEKLDGDQKPPPILVQDALVYLTDT